MSGVCCLHFHGVIYSISLCPIFLINWMLDVEAKSIPVHFSVLQWDSFIGGTVCHTGKHMISNWLFFYNIGVKRSTAVLRYAINKL